MTVAAAALMSPEPITDAEVRDRVRRLQDRLRNDGIAAAICIYTNTNFSFEAL